MRVEAELAPPWLCSSPNMTHSSMLPGAEVDPKNVRHPLVAIFLQIGLRIRYLFESWFFFRPLFLGLSGYKSNFRPKNAPE